MPRAPFSILPAALAILAARVLPGADGPPPRFRDVAAPAGIRFRHVSGSAEKDFIFEVNGSGVALFDMEGDGDLDIYFVNGSKLSFADGEPRPRDALYRNEGSWKFTDATEAAGLGGEEGWGSGAASADVDNDGDLDLHVTRWGPDALYLNRGDGVFQRAESPGDPGMGSSASFGDFNGDGLADIYVANYVEIDPATAKRRGDPSCVYKGVPIFCGPGGLEPAHDTLLLNRGGGRFEDASVSWGVREPKPGYGLGTLVIDIDRDGRPDVVVANDTQPNHCFLNEGGRRFREAAVYLGLAYNDFGVAQAGMGIASGDIRGIGRDDIIITNFEDDTNTLHLAEGGGMYTDGTFPSGIGGPSYPYLGWGTFFFDADSDGDLDLFVANGHVAPQADSMRTSAGYRQRNQIFLNDGAGKFTERSRDCGPGLEPKKSHRGAAFGDLDGDGDPDIVVSAMDDSPTVLENEGAPAAWVAIVPRGTRSNRSAIGARVVVKAGGKKQERTIQSGTSYASQCELAARFGLGGAKAIEAVRIEWPSGLVESFPPPRVGSTAHLVEGTGTRLETRSGGR